MRKQKLLTPILGLTALSGIVAPIMSLTSCGSTPKVDEGNIKDNGVEVVEATTKKSENGFTSYNTKFDKKPDDGKAKVKITNDSTNKFNLELDLDTTSNTEEAEIVIGNDLKANVKVKLVNIPSVSIESKFDLKYTFKQGGQTKEANIKGCIFKYTVSSDLVDITNGYTSKVTPKASWTSTKDVDFINEYLELTLNDPTAFKDDYLYTASERVKSGVESGQLKGLTCSTVLNSVSMGSDGVKINCSFKFKATEMMGGMYKDVDCTFNVYTETGYACSVKTYTKGQPLVIKVASSKTPTKGHFSGKFTYGGQNYQYDGLTEFSSYLPSGNPKDEASFLAACTLGFIFGDHEGRNMSFISPYSKNYVRVK